MALSESYRRELAAAGFVEIRRKLPCRESGLVGREVLDLEYDADLASPHTEIIEGRRSR